MKVQRRSSIQQKLPCIDNAIKQAARKFMPPHRQRDVSADQHGFFVPVGVNRPIHVPTPHDILQPHLDKLPLPKGIRALDLGSGLGSACFTMAADARIREVIGYEYDPEVCWTAEDIATEFEIDLTRFVNQNLFRASLAGVRLIYIYKPFAQHFEPLMGDFLRDAEPGTIVLTRDFTGKTLFPRDNFENIYAAQAPYHGFFFGYLRKLD